MTIYPHPWYDQKVGPNSFLNTEIQPYHLIFNAEVINASLGFFSYYRPAPSFLGQTTNPVFGA